MTSKVVPLESILRTQPFFHRLPEYSSLAFVSRVKSHVIIFVLLPHALHNQKQETRQ
ncbi:hypothetical protein CANARDRAFT_27901 [[Candida] arabinofermentans NRRL YB-2248]|uniref:Uncharacterized protein n=1 Tax=[Candida] arabinofermentans NRRL YB-2248 TaxID=983967 RepID=A0A1E4T263_9ASCO|nr:hypothetical protein CANARDRAFT_27901 [[Candida] arabinofermentans NRRL YB-2248]